MENITKSVLAAKLKALGSISKEQRNEIICSLIGHSRIMEHFWGYHSCARCGVQLGDTLGSVFPASETAVIRGHSCKTCRKNFKECTWKDKLYVRDPFINDFLEDKKAPILMTL